jgi:hypothetical protein
MMKNTEKDALIFCVPAFWESVDEVTMSTVLSAVDELEVGVIAGRPTYCKSCKRPSLLKVEGVGIGENDSSRAALCCIPKCTRAHHFFVQECLNL